MGNMKNTIEKILQNLTPNDEFEILFNTKKGILQQHLQILKETYSPKKIETINTNSLDVIYNTKRVSINGITSINDFYTKNKNESNRDIWNQLGKNIDNDNIYCIDKKLNNRIKDYNFEYDIKYRLSSEKRINTLRPISKEDNIELIFRFKSRIRFVIFEDLSHTIALDITVSKQSNNLVHLYKSESNNEIELEFFKKNNSLNIDREKIGLYVDEFEAISSILNKIDNNTGIKEDKNNVETENTNNSILRIYKKYFGDNVSGLYTINPISLSKQVYQRDIPFNYAVTDKCDGHKIHMVVSNQNIYIVDNLLHIKFYSENKNVPKNFEYIAEAEMSGEKILLYDILVFESKDIRNNTLYTRITYLDSLISSINENKNYKFLSIKKYPNDISVLMKKYKKDFDQYVEYIKSNNRKLIDRKYIMFCSGSYGRDEIYIYANSIWESFQKMPYIIDGIIFTNQISHYFQKSGLIYKWKPDDYNSIDFYIKIKKDQEGNNLVYKFDDFTYSVIELYCYTVDRNKNHVLVPFKEKEGLNHAYLKNINGNIYDLDNNIVRSDTIVEMVYNNNILDENSKFYWSILRTRHDKTKYMKLHKKKYGNHINIALDIFSIKLNPFGLLDNVKEKEVLLPEEEKKSLLYYEVKTNIGEEMRSFHNKIKNMLIQNYCREKEVLDVGIGRGGDIFKYLNSNALFVLGLDPSYMDLFQINDSALSRYNKLRNENTHLKTKMEFVSSDFSKKLVYEIQKKKYMNDKNKEIFQIYLEDNSKKFDVINFSFSFHYVYSHIENNEDLFSNIGLKLKKNGYIIITMFDGDSVLELLDGKDEYHEEYIDKNGERITLFSIKKRSNFVIDVYNSMYNNTLTYYTENLIMKDAFIKDFKANTSSILVETLLFKEYYDLIKPLIIMILRAKNRLTATEKKLKAYFTDEMSSSIMASKKFSNLYRFYVFKKIN